MLVLCLTPVHQHAEKITVFSPGIPDEEIELYLSKVNEAGIINVSIINPIAGI